MTLALLILLQQIPHWRSAEAPLTLEHIAATAEQLQTLLQRTTVGAPNQANPPYLVWSYAPSCTGFQGLLVSSSHDDSSSGDPLGDREFQLWLDAPTRLHHPSRDPSSPALPSFSLRRDEIRSDLVGANHSSRLWATVYPSGRRHGDQALRVNNLRQGRARLGGLLRDSELAPLAPPPRCPQDPQEQVVLEDLMLKLRVELCPADESVCSTTLATLYRGLRSDVYRLDAIARGHPCGVLSLALEALHNDQGAAAQLEITQLAAKPTLQCEARISSVSQTASDGAVQRQRILTLSPGSRGGASAVLELP
ncbi:MAG: hypothetical protein AAGD01_03550 [Acidobacteriota bacterium]